MEITLRISNKYVDNVEKNLKSLEDLGATIDGISKTVNKKIK